MALRATPCADRRRADARGRRRREARDLRSASSARSERVGHPPDLLGGRGGPWALAPGSGHARRSDRGRYGRASCRRGGRAPSSLRHPFGCRCRSRRRAPIGGSTNQARIAKACRRGLRALVGASGLEIARAYGIVLAFVALFVTLSVASAPFLTWDNLFNIIDQNAGVGIIAVGSTLVFIAGAFDLSVGAVYSMAGVVAALAAPEVGAAAALLLGGLLGLGFGVVNGLLATVGRINAFVATLATATMIGGLAVV